MSKSSEKKAVTKAVTFKRPPPIEIPNNTKTIAVTNNPDNIGTIATTNNEESSFSSFSSISTLSLPALTTIYPPKIILSPEDSLPTTPATPHTPFNTYRSIEKDKEEEGEEEVSNIMGARTTDTNNTPHFS